MRTLLLSTVIFWAANAVADPATISGIARIVDGDTLDVGAVRIRLHGIDAPEAGQTCRRLDGRSWACGTEATNRLADLAEGRNIECRALDRDAYGRVIATCQADGAHLNQTMVAEGLAWAFTRFSDDFAELESEVRAARRGIWAGEAEEPWTYRENRWERAAEASPVPGCPIKGNISGKGERIYHMPWSPWYERTRINVGAGERWFCDEDEAVDAGWRAPFWR